eukprot:scaffold2636_cov340-Pavlova_lutheri.AAC.115
MEPIGASIRGRGPKASLPWFDVSTIRDTVLGTSTVPFRTCPLIGKPSLSHGHRFPSRSGRSIPFDGNRQNENPNRIERRRRRKASLRRASASNAHAKKGRRRS